MLKVMLSYVSVLIQYAIVWKYCEWICRNWSTLLNINLSIGTSNLNIIPLSLDNWRQTWDAVNGKTFQTRFKVLHVGLYVIDNGVGSFKWSLKIGQTKQRNTVWGVKRGSLKNNHVRACKESSPLRAAWWRPCASRRRGRGSCSWRSSGRRSAETWTPAGQPCHYKHPRICSVHFYLVEYGKCHRTILSFNLMKWIMSKLICDGQLDNW